jgi:hypothetical protein
MNGDAGQNGIRMPKGGPFPRNQGFRRKLAFRETPSYNAQLNLHQKRYLSGN